MKVLMVEWLSTINQESTTLWTAFSFSLKKSQYWPGAEISLTEKKRTPLTSTAFCAFGRCG